MVVPPVAHGMVLCDQVIVEKGTNKVSFVGTFNKLRSSSFPAKDLTPFYVSSILAGCQGDVEMELQLARLDTGASVVTHRLRLRFPNKLTDVFVQSEISRLFFSCCRTIPVYIEGRRRMGRSTPLFPGEITMNTPPPLDGFVPDEPADEAQSSYANLVVYSFEHERARSSGPNPARPDFLEATFRRIQPQNRRRRRISDEFLAACLHQLLFGISELPKIETVEYYAPPSGKCLHSISEVLKSAAIRCEAKS